MSRDDTESKTIYTVEGDAVQFLPKDVDYYLDKTTLIFGGSGSGKTTIIEELLYLTKDYIPNYLVVAPSTSNKAYRKKLPHRCIKEDLSKSKLQALWDRQVHATQCYNIANDINILEKLFERAPDRQSIVMLQAIKKKADEAIKIIEASNTLDYAQKKSQKTTIEELLIKKTKAIYKSSIRTRSQILERMPLDAYETTALEYLDFNPRIMLVIDDSSEKFDMWMKFWTKKEINIFDNIFFKGRHNFITLCIACHDDKMIDTRLRKNSRVTIYTNSQSLVTSINKKGNGYTPSEIKLAMRLCGKLFPSESANIIKTHQKLAYVRESTNPFRYTIANVYPEFVLGSESMRSMISKMPKIDEQMEDNPFIKDLVKKNKRN